MIDSETGIPNARVRTKMFQKFTREPHDNKNYKQFAQENVIGWDTMPFPAPSDADSSLSLASFTMADTVFLATTLRTITGRRHRVGHRAVACDI